MIDITPLFNAVVALAAVIITGYLVPYIRSKTTKAQFDSIYAWVRVAVQAAEQLYKGSGHSATKKYYVTEFLKAKGFHIDEAALDKMIEAAVLEVNEWGPNV